MKRGQVSFEYLILMGFVTLVLGVILGIALFYTNGVQDRIRITQVHNFANKVVSAAEYIYTSGEPSKTTITTYLPERVTEVNITDNNLIIGISTASGQNRIAFESTVNITGTISNTPGIKKLEILATGTEATINQV